MRNGDLTTGPAKLHKAWEKLCVRWEEAKLQWRDPVAARFEETYLALFDEQINATLSRMRALSATLISAEEECNRR